VIEDIQSSGFPPSREWKNKIARKTGNANGLEWRVDRNGEIGKGCEE
jgi:hypothetical protein